MQIEAHRVRFGSEGARSLVVPFIEAPSETDNLYPVVFLLFGLG